MKVFLIRSKKKKTLHDVSLLLPHTLKCTFTPPTVSFHLKGWKDYRSHHSNMKQGCASNQPLSGMGVIEGCNTPLCFWTDEMYNPGCIEEDKLRNDHILSNSQCEWKNTSVTVWTRCKPVPRFAIPSFVCIKDANRRLAKLNDVLEHKVHLKVWSTHGRCTV